MSIYNTLNHFVTITAFYALSLKEFDMRPHAHESCEIMYVDQGKCLVSAEKEEYPLEKGQFIFLDADIVHRLYISKDSPCSMLNLEFRCQGVKSGLDLLDLVSRSLCAADFLRAQRPVFTGNDSFSLGFSLKDLISKLQKKQPDQDYLIQLLFYRTFLELSHNASFHHKVAGTQYLKKACAYIQEHLQEPLRIPEIASFTGINKSYLQSLFSRHINSTITEYINRQRLEQAVYLLTNSSLPVTDIAFHAGYNSRQHFASTFEKYYGLSPRAYRRLNGVPPAPSTGESQYMLCRDGSWDLEVLKSEATD